MGAIDKSGYCELCGKPVQKLTKDHIIPKRFSRCLHSRICFEYHNYDVRHRGQGITKREYKERHKLIESRYREHLDDWRNVQQSNRAMVCSYCNKSKDCKFPSRDLIYKLSPNPEELMEYLIKYSEYIDGYIMEHGEFGQEEHSGKYTSSGRDIW